MRVHIPFNPAGTGGPASFVAKITEGLRARGGEVVADPSAPVDLVLVIGQWNPGPLAAARARGARVVQRQNGVYYFGVSGWRYPLLNHRMARIRRGLADHVVYQSEYARRVSARFLGRERPGAGSSLIYNGVDLGRYVPPAEAPAGPPVPLSGVSVVRRPEEIEPSLRAVRALFEAGAVAPLRFFGELTPRMRAYVDARGLDGPWVTWLGRIDGARAREEMARAGVFLYPKLNTACPNVVVEAMASGLPVVGFASGALPELVPPAAGALAPYAGDAFWRMPAGDAEAFRAALAGVVGSLPAYRAGARAEAERRFSVEAMTDAYVAAFEACLAAPRAG